MCASERRVVRASESDGLCVPVRDGLCVPVREGCACE